MQKRKMEGDNNKNERKPRTSNFMFGQIHLAQALGVEEEMIILDQYNAHP